MGFFFDKFSVFLSLTLGHCSISSLVVLTFLMQDEAVKQRGKALWIWLVFSSSPCHYPKSCLKALTHQANGRPSDSLGPSVSVRRPSFFFVSRTVGSSLPVSEFFRPIHYVESAASPVGKRNHSDWLFSLNESVHEKRNGSEESKPTSKVKRKNTEGSSHVSSSSYLIAPLYRYSPNNMAIWNEAKWCVRVVWKWSANTALFHVRIITAACIFAVLGLSISLFEWWIQTTATCWCGELFPPTQTQNVHGCWRRL